MKRLFLVIICSVLTFAGYSQGKKGYVINGEIANSKDGMTVWLMNDEVWPIEGIGDTTVIKDGKFQLIGYVEAPVRLKLMIDSHPESEEEDYDTYATRFYLENSVISYTGDLTKLETYYFDPDAERGVPATIKGSKENDLFVSYEKEFNPIKAKWRALNDQEYASMDGEIKLDRKALFELERQREELNKAMLNLQMKYIKQSPSTRVAVDLAQEAIGLMFVQLSGGQIKALEKLIAQNWPADSKVIAEFKEYAAQKAKTAFEVPFPGHFDVKTVEGKTVKLAEALPKGKYVLIEFWDSGCAPCRGDIPHVKEICKQYKNKGLEIVYISGDIEQKDWLKALKAEKMPWLQLWSQGSAEHPEENVITTECNALGFPTTYLLDKEGKIVMSDLRGIKLDKWLEKLMGEPSK